MDLKTLMLLRAAAGDGNIEKLTKSGAMAYFNANFAQRLRLNFNLSPKQAGTGDPYLPGAGPNKLPPASVADTTHDGVRFTSDGNGQIKIVGQANGQGSSFADFETGSVTLPSGDIYVHLLNDQSNANVSVFFYNGNTSVTGATLNGTNRIVKLAALSNATFNKIRIVVANGETVDATLYPMMMLTNASSNYVSYSNVRTISGHDGATVMHYGENLLTGKYVGAMSGSVTFTVNNDGSVSTSGTSTATAVLRSDAITVDEGATYKLFGSPAGGSNDKYRLDVRDSEGNLISSLPYDVGNGATVVIPSGTTSVKIGIRIASGNDTTGLVFKPVFTKVVNWNQLAEGYRKNLCTITEGNRTVVCSANEGVGYFGVGINVNAHKVTPQAEHAYLMWYKVKDVSIQNLSRITISNGHKANTATSGLITYVGEGEYSGMFYGKDTPTDLYLNANLVSGETTVGGETFTLSDMQIFDLTQMFGPDVADEVYALESANAGDGIAWFKARFTKAYYAYDTGTAKSIEAVNGLANSVSVTFPETIYGGEVDWQKKRIVSTMERIDLGSLTWHATMTDTEGKSRFYAALPKNAVVSDASHVNSVCSCLKLINSGATFSCVEGHTIAYSSNEWRVYAYVEAFKTYTRFEFANAVSGQYLVYTPATPIEYSLSDLDIIDLFVGDNTVWVNDSTNIEVTYRHKLTTVEETGYTHENVKKIKFNGNPYAFGNASVANRKNYAVISQVPSGGGGVTVEMRRNVVIVNGTSSGVNDIFLNSELVDIPAGTYKAIITPHMGQSEVVTGKNMYMDFWYDASGNYAVRATFSGVIDSKVETTVTFTSPVVKMRAIVGVRGVKYDDYRLTFELFPSDVSFTDIGSPVPEDGYLDYTFETEQAFVDSRMHTSTVKRKV